MKQAEKNLKTWLEVFGTQPTKTDLQAARASRCMPEFRGMNKWVTPSTSHPGVSYAQEVYFTGMSADYDILIKVDCNCPATGECLHALKIHQLYEAHHGFYFDLFGLLRDARYGQLWDKAWETDARLKANSYKREAA